MENRISNFNDYQETYRKSLQDPEAFWGGIAEEFTWKKKWNKVMEWNFHKPEVKWFIGGKMNNTGNSISPHFPQPAKQTPIIWGTKNTHEKTPHNTIKELLSKCFTAGHTM